MPPVRQPPEPAADDPAAWPELGCRRGCAHGRTRAQQLRWRAAAHLAQLYADHSYLADPVYPALLEALQAWVARDEKPAPAALAARCEALRERFPGECRMLTGWTPPALDTRVPARP
ncbi:MAG: hypothetical protein J0M20_09475 [Burkholderiales bacterium]|nr:hypothetical protein [Burkholderiales bacterium]